MVKLPNIQVGFSVSAAQILCDYITIWMQASLNIQIQLEKLQLYGVCTRWFESYLSNHRQRVVLSSRAAGSTTR